MSIVLPKFFNWEDARRYAIDLMQWGDDGPSPGDITETIEAALEESKRLKTEETKAPKRDTGIGKAPDEAA